MTVSRVINGRTNVSELTRTRVLKAIEDAEYSPNSFARSLAAGNAAHIGMLYSNPSAAYLSQFLIGALQAARRSGAHLVLESCKLDDADDHKEVLRRAVKAELRGVIVPPPLCDSAPLLAELDKLGVPVVTVATSFAGRRDLDVQFDDYAAAVEMTEYLIELGHRRIGFIKGDPNHLASENRARGFLTALQGAGLDPSAALVQQGYFSYRSGLTAAELLLSQDEPPTAIFASNDDMAAAVISVAHRRSLHVPDDLTVVGFDDTTIATTIWPELTTVRQPIAQMAQAAVELLLHHLEPSSARRHRTAPKCSLQHSIIVRRSSSQTVLSD